MGHDNKIWFRDLLKAKISETLLGPYGMEWTLKTFNPLYEQPSAYPKFNVDSGRAKGIVSAKLFFFTNHKTGIIGEVG